MVALPVGGASRVIHVFVLFMFLVPISTSQPFLLDKAGWLGFRFSISLSYSCTKYYVRTLKKKETTYTERLRTYTVLGISLSSFKCTTMWLMGPVMEEAVFSEWNQGFKNGAIMISDDFLVNAALV